MKYDTSDLADYASGKKNPMKITANLATYPPRMHSLKQMVASIYDQVDVIRICFNEMAGEDVPDYFLDLPKIMVLFPDYNLTDNGKFYYLDCLKKYDEYFFTMDDDLIYPHDYVEKTIEAIKKYGMIITYHGRVLTSKGKDYYCAHDITRCLGTQDHDMKLDVCGTGVTAFDTRYFHPKGLANQKLKKMSDLTFSLEAAKQKKKIGSMAHKTGWIRHIKHEENIFSSESKNGTKNQNKLADQIFELNHG